MARQEQPDGTFIERWARKERALGFDVLGTHFVPCGDSILPTEAAPCLTFKVAAKMPRLWQVFGSPEDWSAEDRTRLGAYRVIGTDGAGNPLCVDEPTGIIWLLLDHEDDFRSLQFVNSSLFELAECLLAYMGEHDSGRFLGQVRMLDPEASGEGAFWWHEAAVLADGLG